MIVLATAVSIAGVRVRAVGVQRINARRPGRVVVRLAHAASITRILIGAVAHEWKTACRSGWSQFVRTDAAEAEVVRAGVTVFAINGTATLDTRTVAAHITRTAIVIVTAFGTGIAATQLADAAVRVRATIGTGPIAANLTNATIRVLAARGAGVVAAAQLARATIRVLAAGPACPSATLFAEITVGIRKTANTDVVDLVTHQVGRARQGTFEHTDAVRAEIRAVAEKAIVAQDAVRVVVLQANAGAIARVRGSTLRIGTVLAERSRRLVIRLTSAGDEIAGIRRAALCGRLIAIRI